VNSSSGIGITPLPFTRGDAIVFWITFYLWLIPELIGGIKQRSRASTTRRDRGSQAVLIISLWVGVFFAISCAWALPAATITPFRLPVFAIGILLMLTGVALRWYAIRTLGLSFTRDLAVRAGQRVVDTGVYRTIRHPAYSGTLLTCLGIGLAMTNGASLIAIMACAVAGHLYRVHLEEGLLCEQLGEPYREYMRRTHRFNPFVW